MKKRFCYLFVFDGYADWEPALVTAGLNSYSDFEIKTFSPNGETIKSMGNLSIKPDFKLKDVKVSDIDLLILPGGTKWEEGANLEVTDITIQAFQQGKTVAAICAATTFLAKLGLFQTIKHTSNGLEYLKKQVSEYSSSKNYINEPCVKDANIITANGAGMIEFAFKIFEHFDILKNDQLKYWSDLYKSGGMIF